MTRTDVSGRGFSGVKETTGHTSLLVVGYLFGIYSHRIWLSGPSAHLVLWSVIVSFSVALLATKHPVSPLFLWLKQTALPSFPKNQRAGASQTHGSTSQFTGSAFICKQWGWKVIVVRQTHACLPLCFQEVELAHSSPLLLSQWVCACYLTVVWFPLCCCLAQAWFVVFTDASLTAAFPSRPLWCRDFLRPLLCNILV